MTEEQRFPPEFLNLLRGVSAKRPRTVIDHILEHGQIATEELRDVYGYNHPPTSDPGRPRARNPNRDVQGHRIRRQKDSRLQIRRPFGT